MQPASLLPHSQDPATCPCPEPDRSSRCPLHPTSQRYILILSSHLRLGLPSCLLPLVFSLLKPCMHFSVLFRGFFKCVVTRLIFYEEDLLAPRPAPKLEDHPFSAVRDCLYNIFAATLHIWRPFLHPQTEDAPCRGDRDPMITDVVCVCVCVCVYRPIYKFFIKFIFNDPMKS